MQLYSTRDTRHASALSDAIARGLAPDGGLYVPKSLPNVTLGSSLGLPEIARELLQPFFAGDALEHALPEITREALSFPAPLVPLDGAPSPLDVLELFHGPTAAFKDFGARFLAASLGHLRAHASRRLTVLVATSGDTGGAVAAAFHRKSWVDVVILFPEGRVSPRQEMQLTCWDANVKSIAVRGTFDDCQRLVKTAFLDSEIVAQRDLSSANSINIGRLLPQMVYYAAASLALKQRTGRKASFIVPSGNLGNVMACIWARAIGLPVEEIVLAHNANRAVPDYLETGTWQPRQSIQTLATAMDVGNPSNMERLRDYCPQVESLRREVQAVSVTDEAIKERIREDFRTYGRIWCPHSAVAAEVYARMSPDRQRAYHWVVVATAHPAKFSETIEPLIGQQVAIPTSLASLLELPRSCTQVEGDSAAIRRVVLA